MYTYIYFISIAYYSVAATTQTVAIYEMCAARRTEVAQLYAFDIAHQARLMDVTRG